MQRRLVIGCLSAVAALTLCSSTASASTELGQTFVPAFALPSSLVFQTASGSGVPSYVVPAGGGVITSWSHIAMASPPGTMKFVVLHPVGVDFQAIGVTDSKTLNGSFLNKFDTRIPVEAGDFIGTRSSVGGIGNARGSTGSTSNGTPADPLAQQFVAGVTVTPFANVQIDVSATLEADADHDGFGDETQDKCPTDASTQGACPIPPDKKAPVASTSGSTKQDVLKQGGVKVVISSDEAGSATATGTLNTPGASKTFTLNPASATLSANVKATLTLKLSKKAKKALKKSLAKGKKPKASVSVLIKDAAGNATTVKQTVAVKAKKKKRKRHS